MRTEIDNEIDEIEMTEMTGAEASVKLDTTSLNDRIVRRDVRYKMYKIKHLIGKEAKIPERIATEEFVKSYEDQVGFDGWDNFAVTWDVALHDPDTVVSRMFSEDEEWERTIRAKFPQIEPGGKINYPDLSVQKKVEEVEKSGKFNVKKKKLKVKKN